MKNFLSLILIVCSLTAIGQPVVQRGTISSTVQDARLSAQYNLFMPRYTDTTAANASNFRGVDSCGAIIFTYAGNKVWKRSCSPKRWEEVGSGGTSPNFANANLQANFHRVHDFDNHTLTIENLEQFVLNDDGSNFLEMDAHNLFTYNVWSGDQHPAIHYHGSREGALNFSINSQVTDFSNNIVNVEHFYIDDQFWRRSVAVNMLNSTGSADIFQQGLQWGVFQYVHQNYSDNTFGNYDKIYFDGETFRVQAMFGDDPSNPGWPYQKDVIDAVGTEDGGRIVLGMSNQFFSSYRKSFVLGQNNIATSPESVNDPSDMFVVGSGNSLLGKWIYLRGKDNEVSGHSENPVVTEVFIDGRENKSQGNRYFYQYGQDNFSQLTKWSYQHGFQNTQSGLSTEIFQYGRANEFNGSGSYNIFQFGYGNNANGNPQGMIEQTIQVGFDNYTEERYVYQFGSDQHASGGSEYSVMAGKDNTTVSSFKVMTYGMENQSFDSHTSTLVGTSNYMSNGLYSGAFGHQNSVSENRSFAFGKGMIINPGEEGVIRMGTTMLSGTGSPSLPGSYFLQLSEWGIATGYLSSSGSVSMGNVPAGYGNIKGLQIAGINSAADNALVLMATDASGVTYTYQIPHL